MLKNILNKCLLLLLFLPSTAFAYNSSYQDNESGNIIVSVIVLACFAVFFVVIVYERYKIQKLRDESWQKAERLMVLSSQTDSLWQKETIVQFVRNVFHAYHSAWATSNPSNLEKFLSDSFLKKTVLEMSVVNQLGRSYVIDVRTEPTISIVDAEDREADSEDMFTAEVCYVPKSLGFFNVMSLPKIWDTKRFSLNGNLVEYWKFKRDAGGWQLDKIWPDYFVRPKLGISKIEEKIEAFANENGFYFDPDFGKIMLPDKGKLFKKYPMSQRVSNHTIGMWKDKILEFYLYYGCDSTGDNRTCKEYVVAQAILPKSYSNMILEDKRSDISIFSNFGSSLERIETESVEFNKKFTTCRSQNDRINVLELLTPNLMLHLEQLSFPIYLEIIDNILYIATINRKDNVGYQEMLEVLCWAFDEMKM